MGPRRDLRRTISALQTEFLNTEATGVERDSLKRRLLGLKKEYAALVKGIELTITDEEIDERACVIESTPELAECFGAFWYVMLPQTVDGILQKPAYIKFQLALQQCLGGGTMAETEALANAESDWVQDAYLFGPMNKVAFFSVLFEVLHSWVDLQLTQNYAIFAWGLLTSIADLTSYPPQLRIRRTIPCLPLIKEAARLQAYRNDASLRKQIFEKISSAEYTAAGNVQALARASQRTKQLTVTDVHEEDHMRSMLMVLHRQAVKNQTEHGSGTDTDDDTMTESVHTSNGEIEWRRLETERLRKEEDDRIARFAAKKNRHGALKNRNSRSYFLEVGRGEGSDAAYDLYSDTSWGHLVGAKGGNWIGKQAHLTGGWRAVALMEFLEQHLTAKTAGKTAGEIQSLADGMDMTQMRILWLQELARREAERQFVENRDHGSLDPLTGVFGIVGRRFERVEDSNGDGGGMRNRGGWGVGFPDKGSTHVVENLGLVIGEGPRSRKEQQPKLTESGREALELLRRARERRVEDLSQVLLMPTGELGRVVNRKPLPQGASTRHLPDLGGWVSQLTPSYSRNVRSKSTRPLDTKFQPFLPLTLGGEESEKARRAQDKDKLTLDPQALAARQPPPPLTLLKGLRNLQRDRPNSAGSGITALTSATNATDLTAISGLTGLGGRRRRSRGRGRSRSRSPSPTLAGAKSKAPSPSMGLSAEHREGVLHNMPLLLRNKVARQGRQGALDGFESVQVGMGTRSPGSAGLDADFFSRGLQEHRPATGDTFSTFSGAVAERHISTPFPSMDSPDLVPPNSLELQMGANGKPTRGLALPGAHPSPLLVPARFREDGKLSGSGSGSGGEDSGPESAYTFSPVFIPQQCLDDGRVAALVKESLRLRARLARDEARAAGSTRSDTALDEWVDGGPFPPGLVPSGLEADSWVSGESLSPSILLQHPSSSSMQSASTNTSNANKPQLVLPPLLVLLEALYISKNSGAGHSLESRPRWGGAGTKARRGKEQDAKYYAETMPI